MNNCANPPQQKTKKRKYEDINDDHKTELFSTSKFQNIIEKTRFLSDMFDKHSADFKRLYEKFNQIENDWNQYYLYYFLGDEPKE